MNAVAHVEPPITILDGPSGPAIFHELANLFPLLDGKAYWSLVADVREHGVREPIVMLDGQILDGRNRYLAARECGRPYPVTDFTGEDPASFVVSLNLKRRHLTESQRAMVAAKLAKLPRGANQHVGISTSTQGEAADLLNVSRESVISARRVQEQGVAELVAAVEAGGASVSAAAEIARLPQAEQVEIVEQGQDAIRAVAAIQREAIQPDEKAALRQAVVAAAGRALKGSTGQSRRNPLHQPNPRFDAMASIAGACTGIAEKVSDLGPEFIVGGFLDPAMRTRNLGVFRAGRDALNNLLEFCDAESPPS